jgi:hypothetical protein
MERGQRARRMLSRMPGIRSHTANEALGALIPWVVVRAQRPIFAAANRSRNPATLQMQAAPPLY